jgi:peroxiredoxin Q/BCP
MPKVAKLAKKAVAKAKAAKAVKAVVKTKKTAQPLTKAKSTKPAKGLTKAAKAPAAKPTPGAATSSAASSYPAVGSAVPAFSLPASDGSTVSSADFAGKTVVLYFYPKADTPGCTVEACGFSDAIASYKKLSVPVYGVSPDPAKDVTKFAAKFKLAFPLLADADHAVCEQFGVWQQKSMYGRTYMGAARTTFVLKDGKVAKVFEKVKPDGHDKEVLAWLAGNG